MGCSYYSDQLKCIENYYALHIAITNDYFVTVEESFRLAGGKRIAKIREAKQYDIPSNDLHEMYRLHYNNCDVTYDYLAEKFGYDRSKIFREIRKIREKEGER